MVRTTSALFVLLLFGNLKTPTFNNYFPKPNLNADNIRQRKFQYSVYLFSVNQIVMKIAVKRFQNIITRRFTYAITLHACNGA